MATYRIFHNIEDKRITTCNNDLELIQFVNRVQTENEDPLTYDVDSAIEYIDLNCDNLDFLSKDDETSEDYVDEFEFYLDQKHTVWYRSYFTVKALSYEDAVEKVCEMYRENEIPDDNWEILYDTVEVMKPEDNKGASTIEIYDAKAGLVLQNGE